MTTRAVVFDLFHTLASPDDFRPPGFDRLAAIAELFGVGEKELKAHWWDEVVPVVARTPRSPVEMLADYASRNGTTPGLPERQAADDALGRYQDAALDDPGPASLRALQGVRVAGLAIGLLSNAHERDVRRWPASPLATYFDAALISCFAGAAKPEAEFYEILLADLGVTAAEAMFLGDGGSDEFTGAREVGFGRIVCVSGPAIRGGFRTEPEMAILARQADQRVEGVDEVLTLL